MDCPPTPFELRPANEADLDFVWELRVATMKGMIASTSEWIDETQFEYARESLNGRVVLVDGEPAGMLDVSHSRSELHLSWIAIVPHMQGNGLGTRLLLRAMEEAAARRKPLTLQVLKDNHAALSLYERLGFRRYDETGPLKILMRWLPDAA